MFHSKLYGLNRIGRFDLVVLLLIRFDQRNQHVQSISHRCVRLRIPKFLNLLKGVLVVTLCFDGFNRHIKSPLALTLSVGFNMSITLQAATQARRLLAFTAAGLPSHKMMGVTLWITTAIHLDTPFCWSDPGGRGRELKRL